MPVRVTVLSVIPQKCDNYLLARLPLSWWYASTGSQVAPYVCETLQDRFHHGQLPLLPGQLSCTLHIAMHRSCRAAEVYTLEAGCVS